jgi:F-type H+-transporting ATPase subunit b
MDSFIETFHIDWKIIIAQSINFIIVLFVLYFLIVKPLKKLMKERSENIEGGLHDAKANAELLANTKKEYDAIVASARNEAHTIFQEGKKEAEVKKAEMMENAKKEVDNMILNGKKVLESEKAKILEEAKIEIVGLVVKATEKLLESKSDEKFDTNSMGQIKKM